MPWKWWGPGVENWFDFPFIWILLINTQPVSSGREGGEWSKAGGKITEQASTWTLNQPRFDKSKLKQLWGWFFLRGSGNKIQNFVLTPKKKKKKINSTTRVELHAAFQSFLFIKPSGFYLGMPREARFSWDSPDEEHMDAGSAGNGVSLHKTSPLKAEKSVDVRGEGQGIISWFSSRDLPEAIIGSLMFPRHRDVC